MHRRAFVAGAGLLANQGLSLCALAAEVWPSRTLRWIVPFAAGGTSDILARLIAEPLQQRLRQTVVVENRAGAGGVIGADAVAKSAADGYTLLLGTIASHAINPAMLARVPYDPLRQFAPVTVLGSIPNVLLVGTQTPYRTVADLVAAAKAQPDHISFASAGQGSSQHMSGEMLKLLTGAALQHVPYKGSAPAIQDVIGQQIPCSFETVTVARPHVQAGRVRALAVTSAQRCPVLPEVPTMQEAGVPGFEVVSWQALYVPSGTPRAVVMRLHQEVESILQAADVKPRLEALALTHKPMSPEEAAAFGQAELAKWQKVARDGRIQLS
jgi:tripartite-type tricarboxylate transporter receptor subunit TctC